MRFILTLLLSLNISIGFSQSDSVIIKSFYNTALSEGKAYEDLRSLCKDIGARLSGSAEAAMAIDWGKKKLEEYKLTIEALNNLFRGWSIPVYASNDGTIKYTGNKNQTKVNTKKQSEDKTQEFNPQQYQNLYNSIDGLNNVLLEKPEGLVVTIK